MSKKCNFQFLCFAKLLLLLIGFQEFATGNISGRKYDGLDRVIAPEIKNDNFYDVIYKIAKNEPVHTILEIGSSSGQGSTEAFVKGIKDNPSKPRLFCMEVSLVRFND